MTFMTLNGPSNEYAWRPSESFEILETF